MDALNIIINEHRALVNGKETALAGCDASSCPKYCLRKDARLKTRELFKPSTCTAFIPVEGDGALSHATDIDASVNGNFNDLPVFTHDEENNQLILCDELVLKEVVISGDDFTAKAIGVMAGFIKDYEMLHWHDVTRSAV